MSMQRCMRMGDDLEGRMLLKSCIKADDNMEAFSAAAKDEPQTADLPGFFTMQLEQAISGAVTKASLFPRSLVVRCLSNGLSECQDIRKPFQGLPPKAPKLYLPRLTTT